jgi:hypothetical protein
MLKIIEEAQIYEIDTLVQIQQNFENQRNHWRDSNSWNLHNIKL